jgi:sugar lactone lactonase YvrE
MRRFRLLALGALAAMVLALPGQGQAQGQLSVLVPFDPMLGELPEAIAVDGAGNLYLSMVSGEIKRVTPDGQPSTFAMLPSPGEEGFVTGLAFGPDGSLFVGLVSFDPETHGVWRVAPAGDAELFAELDMESGANGLVFDSAGTLYVSDSLGGKILTVSEDGDVDTWSDDPLIEAVQPEPFPFPIGPNGIALDAAEANLYAVTTGTGRVVRIPVEEDGSAGAAELVAEDVALIGADGVEFDADGNLYIANIGQDSINLVTPDGEVSIVAQGAPLNDPSDVVFGTGAHADTLFVTNFSVLRALGIKEGAPMPALLTLTEAPEPPPAPEPTPAPPITAPETGTGGSGGTAAAGTPALAAVLAALGLALAGGAALLRRRTA